MSSVPAKILVAQLLAMGMPFNVELWEPPGNLRSTDNPPSPSPRRFRERPLTAAEQAIVDEFRARRTRNKMKKAAP